MDVKGGDIDNDMEIQVVHMCKLFVFWSYDACMHGWGRGGFSDLLFIFSILFFIPLVL